MQRKLLFHQWQPKKESDTSQILTVAEYVALYILVYKFHSCVDVFPRHRLLLKGSFRFIMTYNDKITNAFIV